MIRSEIESTESGAGARVIRHTLTSRLFHWLMAVSVLILLATAFLPILGIKFKWVVIHWAVGLVLTVAVILHGFRAVLMQELRSMWFGPRDIKASLSALAWFFRATETAPVKPGKYSPAQKLMHHVITFLVSVTIVTGLLMMVKVDTPFWQRDPYWLSDAVWGIVYLCHGLAALSLISVIMVHIYFALRPEKRMYTRSMIKGWLTQEEFLEQHDPRR